MPERNNRIKDLTGQVFGRLTVIKLGMPSPNTMWLCRCACGTEKEIRGAHMSAGKIVSCGCHKRDKAIERARHGHTRGDSCTKVYNCWLSIRQRCSDKSNKNYCGRGITVCERWMNSFDNFLADMGEPPSPKHQIDRIDNNKGYSPDNCRWATCSENMLNTRLNHLIEYRGERKPFIVWARELGMLRTTLKSRLFQRGWDVEKAFTTPVRPTKKKRGAKHYEQVRPH